MDFSSFFKDKVILVTGGTGSIGSEIVAKLLNYDPKAIRILTNSENELWETRLRFKKFSKKLRFLLGDIRNFERMKRATKEVDFVFNAAAIKHVPISEYNPLEAANVNIFGLENIIESCFINRVTKLVHISTDKAVNPTTVMGATKMLGERLCISRESAKGTSPTIISCVRFGNVFGSRGSIIPLIKNQIKTSNKVTLTDEKMNRFFMSVSQAAELILQAMIRAKGGEIFVLKMPTIRIIDLIEIFIEEYAPKIGKKSNSIKIEVVGPRLGEKIDESLISSIEFSSCYEMADMYIIYPMLNFGGNKPAREIIKNGKIVKIDEDFKYSTENGKPLSKSEIKETLRKFNLI